MAAFTHGPSIALFEGRPQESSLTKSSLGLSYLPSSHSRGEPTVKWHGARGERVAGEWALPVAAAVNGVGTGMYVPFTLVFFHSVTGLSFAAVGAVLTATGLAGIAALPLAGAMVDRYGAKRVQYLLYGVRVLGFALYPLAHRGWRRCRPP
ncbi:MFS transporter [Streptomyces collinus]